MISNGAGSKLLIIVFDYCMVLAGFGILVMAFLQNWSLSPEMIALISTSNGLFSKCIADFHGFEFGSSRSSQAKDAAMASMAERSNPPPVQP